MFLGNSFADQSSEDAKGDGADRAEDKLGRWTNSAAARARNSRRSTRLPSSTWGVCREALTGGRLRAIAEQEKQNANNSGERGSINAGQPADPEKLRQQSSLKRSETGKAASLHAGPSGDVVAVNKVRSILGSVIPRIIQMQPWAVLTIGLVAYVSTTLFFALLFWLSGAECFEFTAADFDYTEMIWLSVHTISSVGFGSAYPVCVSAQIFVLLEAYASLLVQAVIGAYVVFIFMRSRARIRFSRHCLISRIDANTDEDSSSELNFRLVRESYSVVRDAQIYVQVRYWLPDAQDDGASFSGHQKSKTRHIASVGHVSDRRGELALDADQMSVLEHWHVSHRITVASPLWPIRNNLDECLRSVDVSLTAYDTAFNQPVKLYVHYKKEEILHNSYFEPMDTTSDDGSGALCPSALLRPEPPCACGTLLLIHSHLPRL